MRYFTSLIFVSFITTTLLGQHTNFNTQRNWSLNKKEFIFGIGVTQFTGDLGGLNKIGTDYQLVDIDLPVTRMGGIIGYRYRFHPYWATTTTFSGGMLSGDDALTKEVIRNSRNLHFKSMFLDLGQRLELILFAKEKFGARYKLPGLKGMKNKNTQFYLFGGIGVMYYNPKALSPISGKWVALRKLHTEGQGLEGGPKQYLPITVSVPMGIGFRWGLDRMWRMGIEATYVKTFSDYIDDVHGTYYDPAKLASAYGAESAALANPSKVNQGWFAEGQQRGDKQKDAYYTINVMFYRNITYKDYASRRRSYHWKTGKYKF